MSCVFCGIVSGAIPSRIIARTDEAVAFLDVSPLLPGHTLVVPREHVDTLDDLPQRLVGPYFGLVQRISVAVQKGLGGEGSFVGLNTRISQSVPHLHAHVVPRRQKDGLFSTRLLWQRRSYRDDAEAEEIAERIRTALGEFTPF